MSSPTSRALAQRSPAQVVEANVTEFSKVVPSHVDAKQFARVAAGALRRNKQLAQVAQTTNGFASLMSALMECARLGLAPGDTYHLVPFGNEVTGIIDYTGHIEMIYRAAAVSSIKAELVRERDFFDFAPAMERPDHWPQWFGDRGEIIGGYAYAVMKDGATSRVVVMTRSEIEAVRAVSKTSNRSDSPWVAWWDRMALKTLVKQLEKWVPSSAEYRGNVLRDEAEATPPPPAAQVAVPVHVDVVTGELLDEPTGWESDGAEASAEGL